MAEQLTWYVHHTYGAGVVAISDKRLPCRACGEPTVFRIHGLPAHGGCWERAGRPVPEGTATVQGAETAVAATARPGQADEPTAAAQAGSGPNSGQTGKGPKDRDDIAPPRRKKDREERRFQVDPGKEFEAWCRELRDPADDDADPQDDLTDDQCADALAAWHDCVQVLGRPLRFVSWAGYTGVTLYELLTAAHGSMAEPVALQSPLVKDITAGRQDAGVHRMWSFINPDTAPAVGEWVTELDITAQFLGAAASVRCGDGEPDERADLPADWLASHYDVPGYVRLAAPPALNKLRAPVRASLSGLEAGRWLPMPVAKYLAKDHQIALAVDEAVFWPQGRFGARLAKWCETIAVARTALIAAVRAGRPGADLALQVLKGVYASFLGGVMRSERTNDRGTLRHDWNDMTVATAGVNALRALDKLPAGIEPIGGQKDAFWFTATDAPYRPEGLQYSDLPDSQPKTVDKPGKWHVNRWGLITEDIVGAHKRGRTGLLQRAIIDADHSRGDH
jgi:hypothetical protein